MNRKNNVYMIFPNEKSAWMKKDIQILESLNISVSEQSFKTSSSFTILYGLLKQLFFMIGLSLSKKVIICQGAGYHSLVPSMIGHFSSAKVIIIAIGTDCVSYPTINYGNHRKRMYSYFTRNSFKLCDLICPVHEKLINYKNHFYSEDRFDQGIKSFVPSIKKDKIRVINNGYDHNQWFNKDLSRPIGSFLTVVGKITSLNYKLKGLDLIFELAKERKDLSFTIIGTPEVDVPALTNVQIIPYVDQSELIQYYNEHFYYLQLSISEGLPNSLCEAMLCGCIPLGSSNSSIPEIIGNNEFILQHKQLDKFTELLDSISKRDDIERLRKQFRDRIINNYPESRRSEGLSMVLNELTS